MRLSLLRFLLPSNAHVLVPVGGRTRHSLDARSAGDAGVGASLISSTILSPSRTMTWSDLKLGLVWPSRRATGHDASMQPRATNPSRWTTAAALVSGLAVGAALLASSWPAFGLAAAASVFTLVSWRTRRRPRRSRQATVLVLATTPTGTWRVTRDLRR